MRRILPLMAVVFTLQVGPALAANTTITFSSDIDSSLLPYGEGSVTVYSAAPYAPGPGGVDTGVGPFVAASISPLPVGDGANNLFWCVDLSSDLIQGQAQNYHIGVLTDSVNTFPEPISSAKLSQVNALLSNGEAYLTTLSASDATVAGAGLQIALWAILLQSTDGIGGDPAYDVSAPAGLTSLNFDATPDTPGDVGDITDANIFLDYVTNGTWVPDPSYAVAEFEPVDQNNDPVAGQSLIQVYDPSARSGVNNGEGSGSSGDQGVTSVPEPPSSALLSVALIGLALSQARNLRRSAARADRT